MSTVLRLVASLRRRGRVGACSLVVLVLAWVFAILDQRALTVRGYHAPSVAWMLLLPPLIYFIKRGRAVRKESKRAWPPELLYVGSLVLIAIGYLLSTNAALAGIS